MGLARQHAAQHPEGRAKGRPGAKGENRSRDRVVVVVALLKDDEDVSWEDAKKELKKLKNNSAKH